ncbi:MAG: hypothetical protein J07HQW1_00864 [Haloquadratum walsbyi J07HQW1]|uniref:Uncharacterized protein n=1 Tax=Haloquadratum walsbyi J07HQW1 TaxID=1238424 RepID=U1PFH0_9EURY|nr:MAG: hypothetical protein J07HQW1_00864 [Haloquadratum walsbyi J07HQW1]
MIDDLRWEKRRQYQESVAGYTDDDRNRHGESHGYEMNTLTLSLVCWTHVRNMLSTRQPKAALFRAMTMRTQ